MKNGLSAILVGAVLVIFAVMIDGCATDRGAPQVEPPELVDAPPTGTTVADDGTTIEIDPKTLGLAEIRAVRIEAYLDEALAGTYSIVPDAVPISFPVPLEGLEDGEEYRFLFYIVLQNGEELPVGGEVVLRLDFAVPQPEIETASRRTFDPRPELEWTGPSDPRISATVIQIHNEDGSIRHETVRPTTPEEGPSTAYRPQNPIVAAREIIASTRVTWRSRFRLSNGILGPWSAEGAILWSTDVGAVEAQTAFGSQPSIVADPAVRWNAIPGATAYTVEIRLDTTVTSQEVARPQLILSAGELFDLFNATENPISTPIDWRVTAKNELGIDANRSEWFTFIYRPLVPTMETGVPPFGDTPATVILGRDQDTSGTAAPSVTVPLAVPFQVARYEVTAELAASVFDRLLQDGRAHLRDSGANALIHSATELKLLGFGELDFGRQFTLDLTSEGRIVWAQGYRSHPVVGVSWYGAVVLANELSRLAGLDPVYTVIPGEMVTQDITKTGYRLPTEAEWATVVGREVDGSPLVYREDRGIGAVELRGSNYDRSGDRWEDTVPPYTSAGGPTVPVGALGYTSPRGIADLIGNVWEWTYDWYDPARYQRLSQSDETAPWNGPAEAVPDIYGRVLKVLRGGAWNTPVGELQTTVRGNFPPDGTSHSVGFRLVRSLPQTPAQDARSN